MKSEAQRLELAMAALPPENPHCAVLRLGMDDFRILNETFGIAVGDEVLDLAGARLQTAVRKHELVLRLPGDEFAVLLHPVDSVIEAGAAADRLSELLQRAYLVQGEVVHLSACIGVAFAPEDGTQAELLLARAGSALRCAKNAGTGLVQFFEPAMELDRKRRHALLLDLRKALLLNQLEVHYQPQVNVRTGAVIGFEALLRWRHPQLGMIPPLDFIPLAEEAGLMGIIGEWALREACEQAAQLPPPLTMAVNVSPVQFRNGDFARSVEVALGRSGLPGHRLEIEITEGLLLQNEETVTPALHRLHELGVRLAMDDFGTGYSSLGRLARLPFDRIKIDRSLVGGTARQRAVVRAVATLGEGFGITTLAEGIETDAQLACALADGCDAVQGYLFSKAVPPSELEATLQRLALYQSVALGA